MINAKKEFPKVELLLYRLAWRASGIYGLAFEDCQSEAYAAFMDCCASFNPRKKAKFSTWLHVKVWNRLRSLARRKQRDRLIPVEKFHPADVPLYSSQAAALLQNTLLEQIEHLSLEAQHLVKALISTEALESKKTPKAILRQACQEIADDQGWDTIYTKIIVHEIQNEVNWK